MAIDSIATRLTVSPVADWTGQYSLAHIHAPEALYPTEDQSRQTASVMYHHAFSHRAFNGVKSPDPTPMTPMSNMHAMDGMDMSSMPGMDMGEHSGANAAKGASAGESSGTMEGVVTGSRSMPPMHMEPEPRLDLATTAVWGRTRSLSDNSKENSYLLEALLRFASTNHVWTRVEDAGRSNELLLSPGRRLPTNFTESPIGHVAEYSFGYDRDVPLGLHVLAAPGVQVTAYRTPVALRGVYGGTPMAEQIFVRFRLR